MAQAKRRFSVTLDESMVEFVKSYAERNRIPSFSYALQLLIEEGIEAVSMAVMPVKDMTIDELAQNISDLPLDLRRIVNAVIDENVREKMKTQKVYRRLPPASPGGSGGIR